MMVMMIAMMVMMACFIEMMNRRCADDGETDTVVLEASLNGS